MLSEISGSAFLIHRKDLVVVKRESVASYELKKPSRQDAHLADKKLVVNDTARARRISQARFFVPEAGAYRKEFAYILNKVKLYIQYMECKIIYQNI